MATPTPAPAVPTAAPGKQFILAPEFIFGKSGIGFFQFELLKGVIVIGILLVIIIVIWLNEKGYIGKTGYISHYAGQTFGLLHGKV